MVNCNHCLLPNEEMASSCKELVVIFPGIQEFKKNEFSLWIYFRKIKQFLLKPKGVKDVNLDQLYYGCDEHLKVLINFEVDRIWNISAKWIEKEVK